MLRGIGRKKERKKDQTKTKQTYNGRTKENERQKENKLFFRSVC